MVNSLEEPIAAVLDCEIPELVEVIAGRVIIPDGTLIPTRTVQLTPSCTPASAIGAGQQSRFCPTPTGQLRHVGEPIAGSIHDVRAFYETGLAAVLTEHMNDNLVIADWAIAANPCHTGEETTEGELSPAQIEANKYLSGIRSAAERCIAHLKNWKILAPDIVDRCENSPPASLQSPRSNSTD